MGTPAGVRRDCDALEERRLKAAGLLRKGLSEAEVARQVGAHRQSVNRGAQALKESGRRGSRQAGARGPQASTHACTALAGEGHSEGGTGEVWVYDGTLDELAGGQGHRGGVRREVPPRPCLAASAAAWLHAAAARGEGP